MSTNTNADKIELNRRQTIKLLGIAAAAGGASGVSSGEVKLPDDPDDIDISWQDVYFNPLDPTSRFNVVYGSPVGATLTDMALNIFGSGGDSGASPGDIAFHDTALSAFDGWTNAYTLIKNYLKDLPTTMNIRARSAVADAYKAGKTQSEAQQAVADAVYSRADTAARNAVVSKMTLALQLANISATAANTTEVLDIWENTFFGVSSSSYSGTASQVPAETGIVETEVTETITLPSGDTVDVESVKFEVGFDNGDGATFTVSDLLSNYNASSGPYGEFTVTTNNGETITDDFTGTVPSLPSANLSSRRCINMAQLGDIYTEIDQKAQTVIGNYGSTFVGDIYSALDNGTITTGQLRGAEGLASLLSGSTDATESRFQLALSTLYDIPRPDLSEASFMEVRLDGWTDESIRVDTSGNRSRILENRTKKPIPYRGQLFAQNVSTDLKAGETYLFDVPIIGNANNPDTLNLKNSADGSLIWENTSVHVSAITTISPVGDDKILTGSDDDTVSLVNAANGSVIWENTSVHSGNVNGVTTVSADSIATAGDNGKITLLNVSDGSVVWENTNIYSDATAISAVGSDSTAVGSDALITGGESGKVTLVNAADGSVIWENTSVHSGSGSHKINSVAPIGPDSIVTGSNDTKMALLNISDGSVIWENTSTYTDSIPSVAPVGPSKIVAASGTSVTLFDAADGSVVWQNTSVHSGTIKVNCVSAFGPDRVLSASFGSPGTLALLNASDGSVVWERSNSSVGGLSKPLISYQNHDPKDHDGQTYFETYDGSVTNGFFGGVSLSTDSDEFEEVPIRGTMKILSMQDSDGNSVEQITTDPSDPNTTYGPPEYEQLNNTELADRLDTIEKQLAGALEESGNQTVDVALPGFEGPGNILDDLPSFPGFSTVESVIIAVAAYLGIDLLTD